MGGKCSTTNQREENLKSEGGKNDVESSDGQTKNNNSTTHNTTTHDNLPKEARQRGGREGRREGQDTERIQPKQPHNQKDSALVCLLSSLLSSIQYQQGGIRFFLESFFFFFFFFFFFLFFYSNFLAYLPLLPSRPPSLPPSLPTCPHGPSIR
jgi:hypothetical protein